SITCEKPEPRIAASFVGSVPASEIVSIPKSRILGSGGVIAAPLPRSSSVIVDELEHDAAERSLGERAARLRMHALRLDEFHAASFECRDGRQHIGRAEADALQHLR